MISVVPADMIYIGRAIIGMAAGVTTVVLPIYIGEYRTAFDDC